MRCFLMKMILKKSRRLGGGEAVLVYLPGNF